MLSFDRQKNLEGAKAKMLKILCTSVMILGAHGMAGAATISFSTGRVVENYSAGNPFTVTLPTFNATLGTLTGLSFTSFGSVVDTIMGGSGSSAEFTATFDDYLSAIGAGFSASDILLGTSAGPATDISAVSSFGVNYTNSTITDLNAYLIPNQNSAQFEYNSTVYEQGRFIDYGGGFATFEGSITEAFTYTPVREPWSGALLAMAVAGLTIIVSFRRKMI